MGKPTVQSAQIRIMPDQDPDTSYLDQEGFEDRKRAFEKGDFGFVGVMAVAEVEVGGVMQEITSGGIWGIESDSGTKYFRSVGKEEYDALKGVLRDMNAAKIPAYKNVPIADSAHYI